MAPHWPEQRGIFFRSPRLKHNHGELERRILTGVHTSQWSEDFNQCRVLIGAWCRWTAVEPVPPAISFPHACRFSEVPEAHCHPPPEADAPADHNPHSLPGSMHREHAVFASAVPRFPDQEPPEGDALDLEPWAPNAFSRAARPTRTGAPGFATPCMGPSNPRAAAAAAAAAAAEAFERDPEGVRRPGCFFDAQSGPGADVATSEKESLRNSGAVAYFPTASSEQAASEQYGDVLQPVASALLDAHPGDKPSQQGMHAAAQITSAVPSASVGQRGSICGGQPRTVPELTVPEPHHPLGGPEGPAHAHTPTASHSPCPRNTSTTSASNTDTATFDLVSQTDHVSSAPEAAAAASAATGTQAVCAGANHMAAGAAQADQPLEESSHALGVPDKIQLAAGASVGGLHSPVPSAAAIDLYRHWLQQKTDENSVLLGLEDANNTVQNGNKQVDVHDQDAEGKGGAQGGTCAQHGSRGCSFCPHVPKPSEIVQAAGFGAYRNSRFVSFLSFSYTV